MVPHSNLWPGKIPSQMIIGILSKMTPSLVRTPSPSWAKPNF